VSIELSRCRTLTIESTTPRVVQLHRVQILKVFLSSPSGPAKNVLSGAATISMWEILSNLAKIGERAGFTIDTTIQNEKLVFVIGNIPEDKAATLLIQELLAIIFARLFDVESHITHTKTQQLPQFR
jgi:hypothetical protein